MAIYGEEIWTDPVRIGSHDYQFAITAVRRNGTRLWTTSVGLAEYVAGLQLRGSSVELGCGHGLVGMVADATLIDSDPETITNTRETLRLNGKQCRLIEASWDDITEPFDNVFGSEILYPMYRPESVADFIGRCWTRRGVCVLAVSRDNFVSSFESRVVELGLTCTRELALFRNFPYTRLVVAGANDA